MKKIRRFILLIIILMMNFSTYGARTAPSVYKRCNMERFSADNVKIEGLVGFFPEEISWLIKYLKMAAQDLRVGSKSIPIYWKGANRVLLHGSYGNGQHTIARTIAEQTQSVLFEYSIPEKARVRGSDDEIYESERIRDLFAKAREHVVLHKQTVVIFIENIHFVGEDFWQDPKIPIVALWLELDKINDNPNIVVVASSKTNYFLAEPFIDRLGGSIMKINNPNQEMRLELIKVFWDSFLKDIPLDSVVLESIVDLSEGLSIRDIEGIFQKASNAIASGEESCLNKEFLKGQINSIRNKRVKESLKEFYDQAKKHGPKALQAIVILGAAFCGVKVLKNFTKKSVSENQSASEKNSSKFFE